MVIDGRRASLRSASAARERRTGAAYNARGPFMTPKEMRSRRLALGLSIEQLARKLGMPAERVREMESGERAIREVALLEASFARLERARTNTNE